MKSWNWKSEVEGGDVIDFEKGVMWQPCRTLGFINIIKKINSIWEEMKSTSSFFFSLPKESATSPKSENSLSLSLSLSLSYKSDDSRRRPGARPSRGHRAARRAAARRAARRAAARAARPRLGLPGRRRQPAKAAAADLGGRNSEVGEWVSLFSSFLKFPPLKSPRSEIIDWIKFFSLEYSCNCSLLFHDS